MITYFLLITYQILKRRRQRLNIIFAGFFISTIIGNALNIIYFSMTIKDTILALNFLTNFFFVLGPIFILTVNRIILESTIIFSVRRQNIYILFYGLFLFLGMLILILLGLIFDPLWPNKPLLGLTINPDTHAPVRGLFFLIYVITFSAVFVVIPIFRTSLKIFKSFETRVLKKKMDLLFYRIIGSI